MKKPLIALLLAALCLMYTACGKKDDTVGDGLMTPPPTQTASPEPSAEPSATPAPESTASPDGEPGFAIGQMDDGSYKNSFLGIGMDFDDSWTIVSREELNAMNGLVGDSISDEELREKMAEAEYFIDFLATSDDDFVYVAIQKLDRSLGEEDYMDLALINLETGMKSRGVKDLQIEKTKRDFAGKEHHGTILSGSMEVDTGLPILEGLKTCFYEYVVCIQAGGYMAVVTIRTDMNDRTADVASLFYALD